MQLHFNYRHIFFRLISNRNFIITLVLAVGLSPVYMLPAYFLPENDVTEQLYPFVLETKRMLSTGTPWWTWSSFLGDNFIGSYTYYTFTRPLLLAVCALPYKYIGMGLVASIYLNYLILGWLTSCYLRIMGFDRKLMLIGSLLFTLSNFMMCQLVYCMFLEPIQAFVILLICIERFLRGRRFSLVTLTLASFAVAFVNYYFMPASLIATAIYFLCRTLCCYRGRWLSLTFKAAVCVCLGVAMASVVLFPVMTYLMSSPRMGVHDYYDFNYGNNWAVRLLSLVAPMPYDGKLYLNIIDSGLYMNMAYVGIFGVLPYILYASRNRHSWITVVCAVFIVCLVTPLNSIFNLFSRIYYSRWCYALILMLVVATLKYLDDHRDRFMPRHYTIVYTILISIFFTAVFCYSVFVMIFNGQTYHNTVWEIYAAAAILFVMNTVALLLLTRWPLLCRKWIVTCVLSITVIAIVQPLHISRRQSPLNLGTPNIYESVKKMKASRIDCDTFKSRSYFEPYPDFPRLHRNHHIICNRPSITTYISTINPYSVRLGAVILQQKNQWYVLPERYPESAVTLLSVKDFDRFGDYPFTTMPQTALRGDRYIPMGMAYDRYSLMEDSLADVERAKSHDILRGMLASMLIDKTDEPELSRYMSPVEFRDTLPFDSLVAARRAFTCDSFKGDSHGFTATISLPDTMVVMFSTAADPGFTATIDGKPSKIYNVNMGMSASIVPAGRHIIRYEYFPPGFREGALLSIVGLIAFLILLAFEYSHPHNKSQFA